jgi:hypothetical protein
VKLLLAALLLAFATACSVLDFRQECTPALQNSTAYTFTIDGQSTESTATIGAARRGDDTTIVLRDAGDHQTEIRMEIVEPLSIGMINIPDPTASYPSDFVPPIKVSGTDQAGNDGGLFFGGITITDLTESTISGSFAFTLARPNLESVVVQGAFADVEIQNCG